MPRTLSAGLVTAVERTVTNPGWLIEVDTSPKLRYSTRGTLSYGGYTWVGGAYLSGINEAGLSPSTTLSLPNFDNSASSLALSDLLRDVGVTIYAYYDDAVASLTYAVELATLLIDSVNSLSTTEAVFSLSTASQAATHVPSVVVGPPLCNHIPPPGTKVNWGGTVYVLEPR